MVEKKHIELLAPAGSYATMVTAINAGCNAVYFGISDFNMRASAAINFTEEDLPKIVKLCSEKNVRTYVTVNTVLSDDEIEKMHKVVDAVKVSGISAIIAADMATVLYARSKGVEVHISTQLSVSNIETVKFFSQFAHRIVLARELSLEQIKHICEQIKIQDIKGPSGKLMEIEVFAHGAMCVAVSGRCAMSLYCYGTSANKGRCAQVCRRRYKVTDIDTGQELEIDNNYIMSAADLNTIGLLDEIVASGISVLKIEGRGRGPEYVDTVIRTYREALDCIAAGTYSSDKVKQWNKDLDGVFNRGYSKGLYMGRSFDEWSGVAGNKSNIEKVFVGTVKNYYSNINVVLVEIKGDECIKTGEEFIVTGPTTGLVKGLLEGMLVDDVKVDAARQGDLVSFPISQKVRTGDEFYVMRERKKT